MSRTLEAGPQQTEGHHLNRNDEDAVNERLVKRLTEEVALATVRGP